MANDNPRADADISVTDELDARRRGGNQRWSPRLLCEPGRYYDFRPLAVFVRDPQTGKVIGELTDAPNSGSSTSPGFFYPRIGAALGSAAGC